MARQFGKTVAVMRANPPHVNHTAMLRALCDRSDYLNVNLGSANKFDRKNPFKIEEREEMMRLALAGYSNFRVLRLPDVGNDDAWFASIRRINGDFTEIVSNNDYDLRIYSANQYDPGHEGEAAHKRYDILSPSDVLSKDKVVYVKGVLQNGALWKAAKKPFYASGTFVRAAMVNNWNWEDFVDPRVADFIKKKDLIARIRELCPELEGMTLEKLDDGR